MSADLYCLMGNPVEHSRSPRIHTRFAELTGQHMHYVKRLIPLDGFAAAITAFRAEGGRGCNITVPFKFQAAPLATQMTRRAVLAQACNVLRFGPDGVFADNTDGIGMVGDITRNAGIALAGRDILLIGAGGAAAGVLGPLIETRARRIVVANRTQDKAAVLVARHLDLARGLGVTLESAALDLQGTFDVAINGTSSSLEGGGVPVSGSVLKAGALAYDMMYGPAALGFAQWAREHGAHPRDGLGMLVEQAADAFLFWRGVRPPCVPVLAELRASLG